MDSSNPLNEFILAASKQGQSSEQIRQQLLQVGWDEPTVNTAISELLPNSTISKITAVQNEYIVEPHQMQKGDLKRTNKLMSSKVIVSLLLFFTFTSSATIYYFISQKNSRERTVITEAPVTRSAQNESESGFITYTNEEYNFYFHMPNTWSSKEYALGAHGSEKRIAFGEVDDLPNQFFHQGDYAWIKIYPTSDNTLYSDFNLLKGQIGQGNVKEGFLGGISGIDTGTSVAVEKGKYVYEMNLPAEQDASLNWQYTEVSEEIIASFTFIE